MSKQTPETAEKHAVKEWLCLRGYFHFPLMAGMGAYPGAPDIVAIKNGQVYAIEVKKPGGKQSPKQVNFQIDWELHGGKYIIGTFDDIRLHID